MQIIPAIDIINGKAVRLTQGDYGKQTGYDHSPVDLALQFEAAGFKRLHLVDLDGAKTGRVSNLKVLQEICTNCDLEVDFGGGVKSKQDVKAILDAGACMVTIGSLAVRDPILLEKWIKEYGGNTFFVGADVWDEQIKISGWLEDGGIDIFRFIRNMLEIGVRHFFCTDIRKDGALKGPSVELYKKILQSFCGIELTASGGVTVLNDLQLLSDAGCHGAILGKAIYEKTISLKEMTGWAKKNIF